jgi:hypothetical protein
MSHDDPINADAARKFLRRVNDGAGIATAHLRRPGHLQLVSIDPNGGMTYSPFAIGDVDHQLEAVLINAKAGCNTYIETRTVQPGRPKERKSGRGKADATISSYAIVIDSDTDKGRPGRLDHIGGNASIEVETSPNNRHIWLLLDRAVNAAAAKRLGSMVRKATDADHCTGVVTQPYRVAGTVNYPDAKKRARGRVVVPTRLISVSDKLWSPAEIEAAFSTGKTQAAKTQPIAKPAHALNRGAPYRSAPRRKAIAKAKIATKVNSETDRSAAFQSAVNAAVRAGMTADQIEAEMREHPDGPQQKYLEDGDRLRPEIERSLSKTEVVKADPGPAPDASIDGAALLDRIYEFIGRFVVYPDRHSRVAHALWCAHCHLVRCFETTPRLAFLSPEPSSGKTRGLEITELLVPNPVLAVNVSPAYLIRRIAAEEGVTVLFDEIDTVFGPRAKETNEDIRALLNAGYRRGAIVGRCVMQGSVAIPEELPAFAPVALAGLGTLPDTVLSRSIIIRMQRRAPDEQVTPYRRRDHAKEGERLRDELGAWAAAAASRIIVPDMPDEIVDRDADCWEALLAVAEAAGGHWPDTAQRCAVALVALFREVGEERLGVRLLADMRTVLGDDDQAATATILSKLHALDESPWADIRGKPLNDRGLAARLRPYGIKSRTIRIGSTTPKGYRREDFISPWRRYLSPPPEEQNKRNTAT